MIYGVIFQFSEGNPGKLACCKFIISMRGAGGDGELNIKNTKN